MNQSLAISFLIASGFYLSSGFTANAEESISFASSYNSIGSALQLIPNTALPLTSIGNVKVISDSSTGFTVKVQSFNSGNLQRSSGERIPYTLSYNGVNKEQITALTVLEDRNSITECISPTGCNRNIQIEISQTAISAKPAGTYADQLTFILVAK
ncbi:hypothetical protein [Pseudanabaena mucicola]|uniref:Uncharacterized protein n=1 Tax=Pseudanabaena mucicola FACHB-723 TaxID=2692860 RepID=A0ABR8A1J3_9CYAN|nr:hypothetical protein [Pseudanabaena mucicola]MBD2189222.1 hypothetical protein [Pseudanabaena mucicola FACHB-723]